MDAPFHFIPGLELDPAAAVRDVSIKGSRPRLEYGFDLTGLYPTIPSLAPDLAYRQIKRELDEMNDLLHVRHGLREAFGLPDADPIAAAHLILALLDPAEASIERLVATAARQPEEAGRLVVPTEVRPFPLRLASPDKLLHTLAWIDANLKLAVERIGKSLHLDEASMRRIAEAALKLYCYFVKQDEYRLAESIGFNQSMFIQDRVIHLIFGDGIYWHADRFNRNPWWSNRIACDVLRRLGYVDPMRLAGLAVAMGVIWTSRQDVQTLYLQRPDPFLDELTSALDGLCANWGIDDRARLLRDVADHPGGHILVVPDDNGESVFDLALFQELLRLDPALRLSVAVNRYAVSTNIARLALAEVLADDLFAFLRGQQDAGRVTLIEEHQLFPAFEPTSCTPSLRRALVDADLVYIKGVNFFEVFQPEARVRYHGFVVSGRLSALLSGCGEGQNVLARIPGNRQGYVYRQENDVVSLRELHARDFQDES